MSEQDTCALCTHSQQCFAKHDKAIGDALEHSWKPSGDVATLDADQCALISSVCTSIYGDDIGWCVRSFSNAMCDENGHTPQCYANPSTAGSASVGCPARQRLHRCVSILGTDDVPCTNQVTQDLCELKGCVWYPPEDPDSDPENSSELHCWPRDLVRSDDGESFCEKDGECCWRTNAELPSQPPLPDVVQGVTECITSCPAGFTFDPDVTDAYMAGCSTCTGCPDTRHDCGVDFNGQCACMCRLTATPAPSKPDPPLPAPSNPPSVTVTDPPAATACPTTTCSAQDVSTLYEAFAIGMEVAATHRGLLASPDPQYCPIVQYFLSQVYPDKAADCGCPVTPAYIFSLGLQSGNPQARDSDCA